MENKTHEFFQDTNKYWTLPYLWQCHFMLVVQKKGCIPDVAFYATLPEAILARTDARKFYKKYGEWFGFADCYIVVGSFGARPTPYGENMREGKVFHWDFVTDYYDEVYYSHVGEND